MKNKDYYVKWSRWFWYSVFLILFNIVSPIIFEILFIIEETEVCLFTTIFIAPLIILTIIFLKNTIKREDGFSIPLLIVMSVIYIFYLFTFMAGCVEIGEYYYWSEFKLYSVVLPFALGPFLLLINFIISYVVHKKGIILANEKDWKLTLLGILSIIVSIALPVVIILIILLFIIVPKGSSLSQSSSRNENHFCKECGKRISNKLEYCEECSKLTNKTTKFCTFCGCALKEGSSFCPQCGKKIEKSR